MAKVTCLGLDDGTKLNVKELTVPTLQELVRDLAVVGSDTQAVLMKGAYKSVKRVK